MNLDVLRAELERAQRLDKGAYNTSTLVLRWAVEDLEQIERTAGSQEFLEGKRLKSDFARFPCDPGSLRLFQHERLLVEMTKLVEVLDERIERLQGSEEAAWGLIANAYGGDWDQASEASGWKQAAERWRDEYHRHLPQSIMKLPHSEADNGE